MVNSDMQKMPELAVPVRVGVVIPTYNHSGLLMEALCSLERQIDASSFVAVVINDGCPNRETDLACRSFAQTTQSLHFHYVLRANGGLSAARNTGIALLLETYPELEGIYFLDADNRLRPYAIKQMEKALDEHPDSDWFYPDIQMFGLSTVSQYDGIYSGLSHAATNISEAGSLVRRRVLTSGLRFDEGMRQGFEDWDFWLGARERGFKGQHIKNLGFEYRKRPESMLADSHRDQDEIKSYMRRKRSSIFKINNLLLLEAEEAPRYAFILDGTDVLLLLDPSSKGEVISIDDFSKRFWSWLLQPTRHFVPPFIIWTSKSVFEASLKSGILLWCCWDLEVRIKEATLSTISFKNAAEGNLAVGPSKIVSLNISLNAHMVMLQVDFLKEICADNNGCKWLGEAIFHSHLVKASSRDLMASNVKLTESDSLRVIADLYRTVVYIHSSRYAPSRNIEWNWAQTGLPMRNAAYLTVRAAANSGVVMPHMPDRRIHIGVIVSFADFGGVEKVAFNVAQVLRAAGYVPHLVLFRTGNISIPSALIDVFESYSWVTSDNLLRWDGDKFYGTDLSWWSQHGDRSDVVGLLSWFDAVMNCQSADAHGVMGELRRRGVLTFTHQHVVELSPVGRPGGSAMIAKAFEHSYSGILTGSRELYFWFIANGVAQEKLYNVDNAASYEIDLAKLNDIARERRDRASRPAPLRVLFGARMDVQKGLDRLVDIIEKSNQLEIEWRVVGKPIVGADPLIDRLNVLCEIERPVYTFDELTDLYRWADVIILPSRYEGVPLTAIEAMRCGVVMLIAQSGGVGEIIANQVDGILVSQLRCVDEMLEALVDLVKDRVRLIELSVAAMESGRARNWYRSLMPFLEMLALRLPKAAPQVSLGLDR